MQRVIFFIIWSLALLTALAHSLAELALAAFGWRADGYVLNGPASAEIYRRAAALYGVCLSYSMTQLE